MPSGDANRKLNEADRDEIVRLYETLGTPTIARRYAVSVPTVRRILRIRGVESRSASEAQKCRAPRLRKQPVGEPPKCKCGCGEPTYWRAKRARWAVYVPGHYRRDAAYKDAEWLREHYIVQQMTIAEIARMNGVSVTAIKKAMTRGGVQARDASAAHAGRQRGEANPAWKGGISTWRYASDWKMIARKIRRRDNQTCQDCGEHREKWGRGLHVHHIDGDRLNNADENLVSLCTACHAARHAPATPGR